MANIIDYVHSTTETFEAKPLNRVDGLVFSWLANLRIPEEVPASRTGEGASIVSFGSQSDLLGLVAPVHDPLTSEALLRACAASPRFGGIVACHAADEWSDAVQKQFSAVTFLLPQGAFIAFRGTDNTMVGWKENFSMAYRSSIPSQEAATAYVERVGSALARPLWLGGHSKGGNLVLYAVSHCDALARLRIEHCYVYDAPGLSDEMLAGSNWDDTLSLIEHTIPEESFMGLLWKNRDVEPAIVRSANTGIMQHAPFSWIVSESDFVKATAVTYTAYRTSKRFGAWMGSLSAEERERFVELLFKLAEVTGEVTATGLLQSITSGSLDIITQKLDRLPADDRAFFTGALDELATTMLLGPAPADPQTPAEHVAAASDKIDDATARFNNAASKLDKLAGL